MSAADASPFRAAIAALAAGRTQDAVPMLLEAVRQGDGGPLAGLNLGMALGSLGRLREAESWLHQSAAALPEMAEPHVRLAGIAALRGDAAGAAQGYREALRRDPQHVPALAALAALEQRAGRLDQAAALLARARMLDPQEPELDLAEARLALAQGRPAHAATLAEAVLALRPAHAGAGRLLAEALEAAQGRAAALALLRQRAGEAPFSPGLAFALALLQAAAGDAVAAIAELRAAEALAPDQGDILAELGRALANAGRPQEAEPFLRAALARQPTDPDLRNRLATVLWKGHRLAEMVALLEGALAEFGPSATLEMNRALALNAQGLQEAALAAADRAIALGGEVAALVNRIAVLPYHPEHGTAAELRRAALAIGAACGPPAVLRHGNPPLPERRLRLGLLSGGLGIHPVGWLTLAGIEALPEAEFEVAAYSLKRRDDFIAARFRARAGRWREFAQESDAAIAAAIAADGVDILLDMGGYGEGGRPFALQHRPAPVQVKWVGAQFSTTGLPAMDYMLTDARETPPGFERFYSEALLRLPDGYACYTPAPYAPDVAPLPALASRRITFGCFNNLAKITPVVLRAWAQILHAMPQARLLLITHALSDAPTREAAARRMAEAGLPMARVELRPGCPHPALLAAYNEIDIALDPFPYTGGLTICEAFLMGVPVVAMAGESFAGRHAASHLGNLGLEAWLATSPEEYVRIALLRAADPAALAALRMGLRPRLLASPLCDAPRFGGHLAQALRGAWREWCAGARLPGLVQSAA